MGDNGSARKARKAKHILVVAHDRPLNTTRVDVLEYQGYTVTSVENDHDAMAIMERTFFDLILLGRKSLIAKTGIGKSLQQKYSNQLILEIEGPEVEVRVHPSKVTDATPKNVLKTLAEMLGVARGEFIGISQVNVID